MLSNQNKMAANFKFPEAIAHTPRPFVGLTGLDSKHNAIHRTVWDAFETSRKEHKKRINYKEFPGDHIYPRPGREFPRMNYDSYVPVGILKKNWVEKHTQEVPAVLVVFYDLDWNDADWDAKKQELGSRVEVVKSGLQGRLTFLVVVLIQSNPYTPVPNAKEMHYAREKASEVNKICNLVEGQLFLLPISGRFESIIRHVTQIEEHLLIITQKYYEIHIRRIKGHEDLLVMPKHQLLMIRYHFKTAFFCELRQRKDDPAKALEDYKKGYQLIVENFNSLPEHHLELKLLAGFFNYKICRILFKTGKVGDAYDHFTKHMEFFKNAFSHKALPYEHASWMSKQNNGFADLFSEAVTAGLRAPYRNHPGLYYQKAAYYATERQRLCHQHCFKAAQHFPKPLKELPETDYYGERPWRKGLTDEQPSSPEAELEDVALMQAYEFEVEHIWQINPLLSAAIEHFKKYRAHRMVVHLKVKMAEQYYHAKEYHKCLIYLRGAAVTYRQESWWQILAHVLQLMIRCAYLSGKVEDYVTVASEMIGKCIPLHEDEKTRIQANLIKTLRNGVPEQEPGCNYDALKTAEEWWSDLQESQEQRPLTIHASDIACFVEFKAGFVVNHMTNGSISVCVYLKSTAPMEMTFSCLALHFNNKEYNKFACTPEGEAIELIPNEVKHFEFNFLPMSQHTWSTLEIAHVDLFCHSEEDHVKKFYRWSVFSSVSRSCSSLENYLKEKEVTLKPKVQLHPQPAKMELFLEHSEMALKDELFPVTIKLINQEEENPLSDLEVIFSLAATDNQSLSSTTELYESLPETDSPAVQDSPSLKIKLDSIKSQQSVEKRIFIRFKSVLERKFFIRVLYKMQAPSLDVLQTCTCMKETVLTVPVAQAFTFNVSVKNKRMEKIDDLIAEEPFLLIATLVSNTSIPIKIISLEYDKPETLDDIGAIPSSLTGLVLSNEGDVAQECYCLRTCSSSTFNTSLTLGRMTVIWSREDQLANIPPVSVSETISTMPVQNLPFTIETGIPTEGFVDTIMRLSFTLHNKTELVQDFEIKMIQDDDVHFAAAGNQMHQFRILPDTSYTMHYNLVPLKPGHMTLPTFHITYCRDPRASNALIRHKIPSHVNIRPTNTQQAKLLIDVN